MGKLGRCCYSRGGERQKRAERCHSQKGRLSCREQTPGPSFPRETWQPGASSRMPQIMPSHPKPQARDHCSGDCPPPSFLGSPKRRELTDPRESEDVWDKHVHEHWDNEKMVKTGCWEGANKRETLNWPGWSRRLGTPGFPAIPNAGLTARIPGPWSLVLVGMGHISGNRPARR